MSDPQPAPADDLVPAVYDELRAMAAAQLADEADGHSLDPTGLVHEAYLRLARSGQGWADRPRFLAAAARAMRHILVDHARRRGRAKRGGGLRPVTLDGQDVAAAAGAGVDALDLAEALGELAAEDPAKARLVELRAFAGMTLEEAADALGVSRATAARHWAYARAWLYLRLRTPPTPPPAGDTP